MKKETRESASLLSGIASLSLAVIITKILGAIYKIPLSYILNDVGMGYFNVAYTVFGFFYILSVSGIPKAVTIVFSNREGTIENGRFIAKRLLRVFFLIGLLFTVILISLSPVISRILGSSGSLYSMIFIAPSIVFIIVSGVVRGFLTSRSSFYPIAISQIIEAFSKLLIGLLFALIGVKLNMSSELIAAFTILGITVGSFLSFLYLSFSYKKGINKDRSIKNENRKKVIDPRGVFKEILCIAIPITLSSSILSLTGIIDLGVIIRGLKNIGYTETAATAAYGNYSTLALPMLNLAVSVLSPIAVAILPSLVKLREKNDREGFDEAFGKSIFLTNLLSTPIFLSFLLYSFDLLDVLFDSNSSITAYKSLSFLSPAMVLLPLLTVLNTGLESIGKIGSTVASLLLGAFSKLILTFILIRFTDLGILSSSIGTVISYSIAVIYSAYALKRQKIRAITFSNTLLPLLSGSMIFAPVSIILYFNYLKIDSKTYSLMLICASTLIYLILIYLLKMAKKPQKRVNIHKNINSLLSN